MDTHSTGAPWEEKASYSRATKIGSHIAVSGTTAMDGNEVQYPNNVQFQTAFILQKILSSIEELGGQKEDILRIRMFVTNIQNWEQIGTALRTFFGSHRPAATMVEVQALIQPELLIEIEADAIIH